MDSGGWQLDSAWTQDNGRWQHHAAWGQHSREWQRNIAAVQNGGGHEIRLVGVKGKGKSKKWIRMNIEASKNIKQYRGDIAYAKRVLRSLMDAGILPAAQDYFNEMKREGLTPNVVTYSAIVSTCEKAQNLEAAQDYFNEMKREGLTPNVVTYSAMVPYHTIPYHSLSYLSGSCRAWGFSRTPRGVNLLHGSSSEFQASERPSPSVARGSEGSCPGCTFICATMVPTHGARRPTLGNVPCDGDKTWQVQRRLERSSGDAHVAQNFSFLGAFLL